MAFITINPLYKKISLVHAKEILESDLPKVSTTRYKLYMPEEFYIPCGQIEKYISLYDGVIEISKKNVQMMVVGLSENNSMFIPLSSFRGISARDFNNNVVTIEVSRGWTAEKTLLIEIFNKLIEDNRKYDLRLYINTSLKINTRLCGLRLIANEIFENSTN